MQSEKLNLLVASFLEEEFVEEIRNTHPSLAVVNRPDLLPRPRYSADHIGSAMVRTLSQEEEWRNLLLKSDILFDFDRTNIQDLPDLAPNLKWIQGTSSGIHELVRENKYHLRMPNTVFTSAKGIHARPLCEFVFLVILMFVKNLNLTMKLQRLGKWERYATSDLEGKTILIIGLGEVGVEIARLAKAHGMYVIGVKRKIENITPESLYVNEIHKPSSLSALLPRSEFTVLIAPHTSETENMIGTQELALMPRGSVFINISRGALVDEKALIECLQSGHLKGAGLDVFKTEPLPPDSPFWDMENVLVSPHSGSTSDRENRRLTDLFCHNLDLFMKGKPMLNVLQTADLL